MNVQGDGDVFVRQNEKGLVTSISVLEEQLHTVAVVESRSELLDVPHHVNWTEALVERMLREMAIDKVETEFVQCKIRHFAVGLPI